jgi:RND family efflux transporter MFP subunit
LQSGTEQSNENGNAAHAHNERVSTDYPPNTGRLLAIAVGAFAVLLVIGFAIAFAVHHHTEMVAEKTAAADSDAMPVVEATKARPTAHDYPLTLPGQTAGWDQGPLFARVDGYVGSWSADIGDQVKQGQVLAVIETPDLDQQLNAAKAKVAASAAQETVAESSVSIAKLTYDRWKDSPRGVVSEQEREEKKATYEEAVARLAAAKAQTQLDQADVARYNAMEGFKNLTAPYDGVITARHVNVGNLVSAGSSANTTWLYNIATFKTIRVYVDVPQKAAAGMTAGLMANVTSDQFPGRRFEGKITRNAMSIDTQTRTEQTEVDIPNPDLTLVPGMYVQVTFELNQNGLQEVPAAAILFRPGGLQVAVVGSDDKVEFHDVKVARDNGDTVVLSSGVNAGDRVALNLSSAISAGERVTVDMTTDSERPSSGPNKNPPPSVLTHSSPPE